MNFIRFQNKLKKCKLCEGVTGPPFVWGAQEAKIVQISQAPSQIAIKNQKPWSDTSGSRLKYQWYQIPDKVFYNPKNFYITALAHCFPGKNKKGGDKKAPLICARTWLDKEISYLRPKLLIVIGKQAAQFLFPGKNYRQLILQNQTLNSIKCLVLPHASPANIKWLKDNPEFEEKRLPQIRKVIHQTLAMNDNKINHLILKILSSKADLTQALPVEVKFLDGRITIKKKKNCQNQKLIKYSRRRLLEKIGWPVNAGTYKLRDPASPVAVVCPGQDEELEKEALSFGAGITGPCVSPDRGVELVVSNIISNPNIRYLIIAGNDSGHLSGDILYCLVKYGIDKKTRRVLKTKCPTNPYLLNLPSEAIKRFREQVTVVNLRKIRNLSLIGLVIRGCMQEPENRLIFEDKKLKDKIELFDKGTEGQEPVVVRLGESGKVKVWVEGGGRVGTTIHGKTIADVYLEIKNHILAHGSFGIQESTRKVLDVVGTQIVIHDVGHGLIPKAWFPHGWMKKKSQVKAWLEAYARWVYLLPLSDVRWNQEKARVEPYLVELGKMHYSYGTRLTAYGFDSASKLEQRTIRKSVGEFHQRFLTKLPTFGEILNFYRKLRGVQKKTFNSLDVLAQAVKLCVKRETSASYRNYVVLQDPTIDIKPDLFLAHNPCFCLFEVYPRKIRNKWQLDTAMFLRANDLMAIPADAAGGIELQRFLAWYAGIKPGIYLQHTGCAHIQDYLLPKEVFNKN